MIDDVLNLNGGKRPYIPKIRQFSIITTKCNVICEQLITFFESITVDSWNWPERTPEEQAREIGERAYADVCPLMNRVERRTARGKLLVAQGELARVKAEMEFWKQRALEAMDEFYE